MLFENVLLWNLCLENCDLYEGDFYKFLKVDRILLCVLNLKGNEFGDEDVIIVGFFLEWNEFLEELDFSWNVIYL